MRGLGGRAGEGGGVSVATDAASVWEGQHKAWTLARRLEGGRAESARGVAATSRICTTHSFGHPDRSRATT